MRNIKVKNTMATDFEKIYPLLQEFNAPYTKEEWSRIFTYKWDGVRDYVGFHLEDDDMVVGYVGLIFSCRNKQNRSYQFCNITSLIIKNNYRAAALLLIKKITKIENTNFIVLSPIYESFCLFKKLGFTPFENKYLILPMIYGMSKTGVNEILISSSRLDKENRRIASDHATHQCKNILINCNECDCFLIYKVIEQSYFGFNFKKIHLLYVSDIILFNDNLLGIVRIFKNKFGVRAAFYLDCNFINRKHALLFIKRKTCLPRMLEFNPFKEKISSDKLYSEAILL